MLLLSLLHQRKREGRFYPLQVFYYNGLNKERAGRQGAGHHEATITPS